MQIEENLNVDPSVSHDGKAPEDPSNTNSVGKKVEQGIVDKRKGITEQSSEWEEKQDTNDSSNSLIPDEADKYIKNPSPEDRGEI